MSDIHIPPAALEAAAHAYRTVPPDRTHLHAIRAACLAMIKAWPGMKHYDEMRVFGGPYSPARLILPLTEASDE